MSKRKAAIPRATARRDQVLVQLARPALPCPSCGLPMIPADGHEDWPDCHNESECLRTTCESWTWTKGLKGACCGKDWVTVLVDVDGEKAIDLVPAKKRKAAP